MIAYQLLSALVLLQLSTTSAQSGRGGVGSGRGGVGGGRGPGGGRGGGGRGGGGRGGGGPTPPTCPVSLEHMAMPVLSREQTPFRISKQRKQSFTHVGIWVRPDRHFAGCSPRCRYVSFYGRKVASAHTSILRQHTRFPPALLCVFSRSGMSGERVCSMLTSVPAAKRAAYLRKSKMFGCETSIVRGTKTPIGCTCLFRPKPVNAITI